MSTPTWSTLIDVPRLQAALAPNPPRRNSPSQGAPDIVLLDVRYDLKDMAGVRRAYETGHLPGAHHADVDHDLSAAPGKHTGRHPLPDIDAFQDTCSAWGIGPHTQVVCYDDWGGAWASRAWWLLRYYGHYRVAVLDGGLQAWSAAGGALESGRPPAVDGVRFRGHPGAMPTVTTWEIMTREPRCLVDARAPERYRGEIEPIDPAAGHIPHAHNVPFTSNTDANGRFLSDKELRARYEALLDGQPADQAAFYCGSGVTAPHNILAMEHVGLKGAALYPGSWSEWSQNTYRPIETGSKSGR